MSVFAHFLYDHDLLGNGAIRPSAFKPRRGTVSLLLEDGLGEEEIQAVGQCVLARLNQSRDEHHQTHATLEGRGQLLRTEIEEQELAVEHVDVRGCFPECHHWNINRWPDDDIKVQQIAGNLARIASGRIRK